MFLKHRIKKIQRQQENWQIEKIIRQKRDKIQKQKYEIKSRGLKRRLTTTKITLGYLMIVLTAIQVFTGYVTYRSMEISAITEQAFDFTPLVALIGACVSEVFSFAVYVYKAAKENTAGGITYETVLKQRQSQQEELANG